MNKFVRTPDKGRKKAKHRVGSQLKPSRSLSRRALWGENPHCGWRSLFKAKGLGSNALLVSHWPWTGAGGPSFLLRCLWAAEGTLAEKGTGVSA